MRKPQETMISVPLKRYEQLVEELVKTKIALVQKIDELGKTRTRLRREEDERTETVLFGHNDADLSDICKIIIGFIKDEKETR